MPLRNLVESKAFKLYLLTLCCRRYGFRNALRMALFVGRTTSARTLYFGDADGSRFTFTFRGRLDQGALSHLYKDGVQVVDTPHKRVRAILDCGANIGVETLRFRMHNPYAEILAVEADPDNFAILKSNCRDSKRVTALHAAVWSSDTELFLRKSPDGNPESSSVNTEANGFAVPAYSIESLMRLRGWSEIDILKLDVEGAEHAIFSGDTQWLDRVNCLIFEVPDSDRAGTLQLIFERLKRHAWNGIAIGENLALVRQGLPWIIRRVSGVFD